MTEEILGGELAEDIAEPASEPEEGQAEASEGGEEDPCADDVTELKEQFPELSGVESVDGLENGERYRQLRALGLTPTEAYRAVSPTKRSENTRAHLSSAMPRVAVAPATGMSRAELSEMRRIFTDLSDTELRRLYKKVTN